MNRTNRRSLGKFKVFIVALLSCACLLIPLAFSPLRSAARPQRGAHPYTLERLAGDARSVAYAMRYLAESESPPPTIPTMTPTAQPLSDSNHVALSSTNKPYPS
jgi:hypothetical protein